MSGEVEGCAPSGFTKLALNAFLRYFVSVGFCLRSHTMCGKEGTFGQNAASQGILYPDILSTASAPPPDKSLERTHT